MQPITQAKIDPNLSGIRQLRAAQEFFWSDRLFRTNYPEKLLPHPFSIFLLSLLILGWFNWVVMYAPNLPKP